MARDALDVAKEAARLWRSVRGNDDAYMQCQRFDGYCWQWAWAGTEAGIVTYASARLARLASTIRTTNINDSSIQAGDQLWWRWDPYDHVGTVIGFDGGRTLCTHTGRTGDTVMDLGNGIRVSHADTITLPFVGSSRTNGRNAQRSGLTPYGALQPTQRLFTAYTFRRAAPTTQSAKVIGSDGHDGCAAGVKGNFVGWKRGENVNGSDLWLKGISDGWFHISGLTPQNTDGLQDLNDPALLPTQRRVLAADAVNRRVGSPSSSAPAGAAFPAGSVVDFTGWIRGESVSGNSVWFAQGTDYAWSGGFEGGASTAGLSEIQAATKVRTVGAKSTNIRKGPHTSFEAVDSYAAGTSVDVTGWAKGESVSGVDVWFLSAKGWSWAGGFTSQSTDGIPTATAPDLPSPPVTRTPVYPYAAAGYSAPLGKDRPADEAITTLVIHHCAATADQLAYFLTDNDRASCPTWYVRTSGEVVETISPALMPSSTKGANGYSVAIETQNTSGADSWGISKESHEAIAQIAAWLSLQSNIGGHPVRVTLDRSHVVGHREVPGNSTACPGPAMDLDWIVKRALEIVAPDTPPVQVSVDRSWLEGLQDEFSGLASEITTILK